MRLLAFYVSQKGQRKSETGARPEERHGRRREAPGPKAQTTGSATKPTKGRFNLGPPQARQGS